MFTRAYRRYERVDYFLAAALAGFFDLLVAAVACAFLAGAIWPALAPHFLQNRSLLPSSRNRAPKRAALLHDGQKYFKFDS